jgi:hypothetical protein
MLPTCLIGQTAMLARLPCCPPAMFASATCFIEVDF